MFDELLDQLDSAIKQANTAASILNKQFRQTKLAFGIQDDQGLRYHNPTLTYGKATSFSKSQRFKPLQKEQAKTTDCFYQTTENQAQSNRKGVIFTKSQRFQKQKIDDKVFINPNYNAVKKNNQITQAIMKQPLCSMDKSRLSQATAASETTNIEVGPGKYFIQEEQTQRNKRNAAFSKSKRFKLQKQKYQDTPLYIQENQVKKRPPTAALMKPKTKKNKKLISKQKQQQLRQKLKMVYWKFIPLELDRLIKKNISTPLLKEKYFDLKKMTKRQRQCAILMLLDRLNYVRGGYENDISTNINNATCAVVYRKSTPKPFKFSQMEPGPDYYYPQDDLLRDKLIVFSFGKQGVVPQKKTIDHRDYQINQQIFKKGGNIIINPEQKAHKLTEQQIRSLNRGPGFYDCLFSQVQKRNDIGVVKLQKITQKNDRKNNCIQTKQTVDAVYYPSYEAIDPNTSAPLYKQPANIKPAHMPDKQIFPEHWLFYDGDLNKVRAQIAKNVLLAQGMDYKQYKKYTKKMQRFKKYLQERRKQVQKLEYEVNYAQIDKHVQGFQMDKQLEKTLIQPITKSQFDVDGDNLLLSPEKQKKRLADFDFGKLIGRQDPKQLGPEEIREGDILIISPKKLQKHKAEIDFKKMVQRPQIKAQKHEDQQPEEGDRIILNPKLPEKKLPNIIFQKQLARPEIKTQTFQDDPPENIISYENIKPKKIKGFVEMQRMTSAKLVPYLRNKKKQDKNANIEQEIYNQN